MYKTCGNRQSVHLILLTRSRFLRLRAISAAHLKVIGGSKVVLGTRPWSTDFLLRLFDVQLWRACMSSAYVALGWQSSWHSLACLPIMKCWFTPPIPTPCKISVSLTSLRMPHVWMATPANCDRMWHRMCKLQIGGLPVLWPSKWAGWLW